MDEQNEHASTGDAPRTKYSFCVSRSTYPSVDARQAPEQALDPLFPEALAPLLDERHVPQRAVRQERLAERLHRDGRALLPKQKEVACVPQPQRWREVCRRNQLDYIVHHAQHHERCEDIGLKSTRRVHRGKRSTPPLYNYAARGMSWKRGRASPSSWSRTKGWAWCDSTFGASSNESLSRSWLGRRTPLNERPRSWVLSREGRWPSVLWLLVRFKR